MPNGEQYNYGKEIGGLRSDVQNMGKYLGEKIDYIGEVLSEHSKKIAEHEKWIETNKGISNEKKSIFNYVLWFLVSANIIISWLMLIKK